MIWSAICFGNYFSMTPSPNNIQVADCLSCLIKSNKDPQMDSLYLLVHNIKFPISSRMYFEIADLTSKDTTLRKLQEYILEGWPDCRCKCKVGTKRVLCLQRWDSCISRYGPERTKGYHTQGTEASNPGDTQQGTPGDHKGATVDINKHLLAWTCKANRRDFTEVQAVSGAQSVQGQPTHINR